MKISIPYFILATLCLFFISCNEYREKNSAISKPDTTNLQNIKKPAASFSDTLVVKNAAAVFYNPDSMQFKKIEKVNSPRVFSSLTQENFHLMRNARIVISKYWPKLKIIETNHVRYILFVKKDKSLILVDLDTKNDISGIILFNGIKDPLLIDMMNIDTQLNFYYNQ